MGLQHFSLAEEAEEQRVRDGRTWKHALEIWTSQQICLGEPCKYTFKLYFITALSIQQPVGLSEHYHVPA